MDDGLVLVVTRLLMHNSGTPDMGKAAAWRYCTAQIRTGRRITPVAWDDIASALSISSRHALGL